MKNKVNSILKQVAEEVTPTKEELSEIKNKLKDFTILLDKNIKKNKIKAVVFVGGSFAKKTVIKKKYYDVDLFVRFDQKYEDSQISKLLAKVLKSVKKNSRVHGSRDYYRIKVAPNLFFEVVPVRKVSNPKEAYNITDLSYSHVAYMNKKVKDKKILEDIRIAKAFCHANNVYGAESYIKGFSGYSLELIVYYYGGFMKFIKAVAKVKINDKLIIDIEKHYKNKQHILMDLNSSKLASPIILIDPTYKQRNALAALSQDTFKRFQEACKKFLKNPSMKSFEQKIVDIDKVQQQAKKSNYDFIMLESKTGKQSGDIAGSKLLKFYNHLTGEIEKLYIIKKKGFRYDEEKTGQFFYVVKKKGFIIFRGPNVKDKKNVAKFRKKHKKIIKKGNSIYAREKIDLSVKQFIVKWKVKNNRKIREMAVKDLRIIK